MSDFLLKYIKVSGQIIHKLIRAHSQKKSKKKLVLIAAPRLMLIWIREKYENS